MYRSFVTLFFYISLITDDASWGSEREVTLEREVNKSFGISIVGGKVNKKKRTFRNTIKEKT